MCERFRGFAPLSASVGVIEDQARLGGRNTSDREKNSKPLRWEALYYIDNPEAPEAPAPGGFREDFARNLRSIILAE